MGDATTLSELIANPESEKVFLAELNPAQLLTGWSLTAGTAYTYEISFLNETITLADSTTETIRKEISSVEEDGSALTEKTSIAQVEASSGTYWHDTTNGKLYVRPSGSDDPADHTMVGFFWLYFATKGIELNNRYYEPYIAERGVPSLRQHTPNIHWGVSEIGGGGLVLLNSRGYFDQISQKFLWLNKTAKILMGGDSLPYSEYRAVFTGLIADKQYTRRQVTLQLKSNAFNLFRSLPINNFWTSNYPNLESSAQGRPIPIYYGKYDENQAPVVTCINTAYGTNQYQFKICDHPVKSITQAYVDYNDGNGWQTISHANEDLTNATFTITSASFVVGTSKVKVAFEGKHSGGTLIEKGPYIVEDILTVLCGYAASRLDSTAFAESKSRAEFDLNVAIEKVTSVKSIIEKSCVSDLAYFDEDGAGLLRYRVWQPEQTGSEPVVDEMDFSGIPQVSDDTPCLYWRVLLGYSYLCADEQYLWAEEKDDDSTYKYGKDETLELETYIRGSSHAQTLAQRFLFITADPSPLLSGELKVPIIDKLLGDKIKITLPRAPFEAPGGYDERVFELFGIGFSFFPVTERIEARDLMDYGKNIGKWMADTAPAWGAATQQERDNSGFWCDANGYADPSDQGSLNVSRWW